MMLALVRADRAEVAERVQISQHHNIEPADAIHQVEKTNAAEVERTHVAEVEKTNVALSVKTEVTNCYDWDNAWQWFRGKDPCTEPSSCCKGTCVTSITCPAKPTDCKTCGRDTGPMPENLREAFCKNPNLCQERRGCKWFPGKGAENGDCGGPERSCATCNSMGLEHIVQFDGAWQDDLKTRCENIQLCLSWDDVTRRGCQGSASFCTERLHVEGCVMDGDVCKKPCTKERRMGGWCK